MSEKNELTISAKEIKKLAKLVSKVYNTSVVLEHFCSSKQEIDELHHILPIIELLRQNSDELNSILLNSR